MSKDLINKNILVVIPHSSVKRPNEIKKEWLSKNHKTLLYKETAETDRYSDKIYDFRSILGNRQVVFPISQVYLNICRHPKEIDSICPLKINDTKIYCKPPSISLRKKLVKKYAYKFYKQITSFKKGIILTGHTTISGHISLKGVAADHIIVSNILLVGKKIRKFAPDGLVELYVSELKKRLPKLKISINSAYVEVYDYLCDNFAWHNLRGGVPIIHQETDENLYIKNNKPDYKKINKLRKIFAEALYQTVKKYEEKNSKKDN